MQISFPSQKSSPGVCFTYSKKDGKLSNITTKPRGDEQHAFIRRMETLGV